MIKTRIFLTCNEAGSQLCIYKIVKMPYRISVGELLILDENDWCMKVEDVKFSLVTMELEVFTADYNVPAGESTTEALEGLYNTGWKNQ